MHINLSPEMEQFVQSKVDTGFYSNASDVIRDAIRRMREEDEKIAAVRAALREGDEQLDAGKGIRYSRDVLTQATGRARANAKRGKKVKSDVRP
jgi:antitoxin ParD1/3/4